MAREPDDMVNELRRWLRQNPYSGDLGVEAQYLDDQECRLLLPYDERQTGWGVVHGGAIASLAALSAHAIVRTARPYDAPSTVSLHVGYARAARGTSFTTRTCVVRHARELGFFDTRITDQDGRDIANASATISEGRHGGALVGTQPTPTGDPGLFNTTIEEMLFLSRRGLVVTGVDHGQLDMTLPPVEPNLDHERRIHEGALLTLIDAAGASCPWTIVAPSRKQRGATVALHAHVLGPLPGHALFARAWVRARDSRMYWCDVTVFDVDERVHALGTVVYWLTEDR